MPIPVIWDGKKSILDMKQADFHHWRQMEWIGFYFQFLCERRLSDILKIPGPKYGNVEFDGFKNVPWDFKAHVSTAGRHNLIVNDSEATANAVTQYGEVGLILACGEAEYDDANRNFKKWHDDLKGGRSQYEVERIRRGARSRLRKTFFRLEEIRFIKIADELLVNCGSFQEGFRNADGSPRRSKVKIDLRMLDKEVVHSLKF